MLIIISVFSGQYERPSKLENLVSSGISLLKTDAPRLLLLLFYESYLYKISPSVDLIRARSVQL
jgi:hypothetical protein